MAVAGFLSRSHGDGGGGGSGLGRMAPRPKSGGGGIWGGVVHHPQGGAVEGARESSAR